MSARFTNVPHLEVVVLTLCTARHPVAVMKTFAYSLPCPTCQPHLSTAAPSGDTDAVAMCTCPPAIRKNLELEQSVKVDVVANHGTTWIRLRAASARAVEREFLDDPNYSESESDSDWNESDDDDDGTGLNGNGRGTPDLYTLEPASIRTLRQFVTAAAANPIHGSAPSVVMHFTGLDELDARVDRLIRSTGVLTHVSLVQHASVAAQFAAILTALDTLPRHLNAGSHPLIVPPLTSTVNLDGSTLIALASQLSHTHTMPESVSAQPIFAAQLESERATHLLVPLTSLLARHRLVATRQALAHFQTIMKSVAGPTERIRVLLLLPELFEPGDFNHLHDGTDFPIDTNAEQSAIDQGKQWRAAIADGESPAAAAARLLLPRHRTILGPLQRLRSIESIDGDDISPVYAELERLTTEGPGRAKHINGRRPGKFKWSHATVLGTAHMLGCVTITANLAMVRSVQELGIACAAWVHQPRSLTEQKSMLAAALISNGQGGR
ncbi:hypothetical protein BC828DRAFT_177249 [Blastocladiella britannica]|nr:hypothetical protein BC828DRAFT_177249 [Blastocladiella britannica]